MRITKQRQQAAPPGITGTARVDRRTSALVSRLRPGDIAVIDHLDLDRATALRLVDAEVAAVVNVSRFVSGRHPARGAGVLLEAGVPLVDGVAAADMAKIREGASVRLHEQTLWSAGVQVARGEELTAERLAEELAAARDAMPTQLATLTHNTTELLRREERLLLHGQGLPRLRVAVDRGPVLVIGPGATLGEELRGLRAWLRHQQVTVVAVGAAAVVAVEQRLRVDVAVLGSDDLDLVPATVLRAARDVVRVGLPSEAETDSLTRLGVQASVFDSGLATHEAALVLAAAAGAPLVVSAGQHADVASLLDRQGSGASTLLARLAGGDRIVDARVVPHLWSGHVRSWQLWLVLLAGLIAVVAAIAVTPVGQDWWTDGRHDLLDSIRGLL